MQQRKLVQNNRFLVGLVLGTFFLTPFWSVRGQEASLVGERHFRVRLTAPLSSDSSVGSKVSAQVVAPTEFAGDILEGDVAEAHSSNVKDKESKLSFKFSQLYHKESKIEIQ